MVTFQERREKSIVETRKAIAGSIGDDFLITQAINTVTEIDRNANILSKRLREWFELYLPELSHEIPEHEQFITKILTDSPIQLKKAYDNSMGAELEEEDVNAILGLAEDINNLYARKEKLIDYIKIKMEAICPHVLEVAGPLIGAKLLAHKGTLRELALLPSSTIQLLGAEKALFRHLKTHARSPKYGYILQHNSVATAENKGKAARQLANKIALAARMDYFDNSE
jgi:nucleolar protein 56